MMVMMMGVEGPAYKIKHEKEAKMEKVYGLFEVSVLNVCVGIMQIQLRDKSLSSVQCRA